MSPRAKLLNLLACALGAWGLVVAVLAGVIAVLREVAT